MAGAVHGPRVVHAPRGTQLSCKAWPQEAAMRMLMNNVDPEIAEHPDQLIVYGGGGKAARSWAAFDAIVASLRDLENDETLLVQSGKPVGIFRTHEWAPRVLIANANLVPEWANWPEFRRLDALGLTMYGQMTAGSWIYIGTQGILQGTYETFAAIAAKRFGGTLAGTITLTAGLGGMGGAQPMAVTMNEGVAICVEIDPSRIQRRLETGYLDVVADSVDDALDRALQAKRDRTPLSIAVLGNAADVVPELLASGAEIDVVTDQTSAHDPLMYVPSGATVEEMPELRLADPVGLAARARESMAAHVDAMIGFLDRGAEVFDYGNSIRAEAKLGGCARAFDFPGFVPAYVRPLFCEGKGPFRWVALSGDPADIAATDQAVLDEFPDNEPLARWIRMAGKKVKFQGLPSRICWLGYGERDRLGLRFNEMVARGDLKAPIVIGRDHLDTGSVASPYRETEGMRDGSDAIADWPLLNALLNTASGASWVSIHHGGGVGIGRSIHAGQVTVADGSALAAQKLERVLTNDPGSGVVRHADAGYPEAERVAAEKGLRLPMREFGGLTVPYPLNDTQRAMRQVIRDFCRNEVMPGAAERDRTGTFPAEIMRGLGELGAMGITVPESWGGLGLDTQTQLLAIEEVARADAALASIYTAHLLALEVLVPYMNEAQKRHFIPEMASGMALGAFALTEPGSGSDIGGMDTVARRDGDAWVVSGSKTFISNAADADTMVLFAKTDPAAGFRGISAFVLSRGTPGVSFSEPQDKLGIRSAPTHTIYLDGARIGDDRVIGELGTGGKMALSALNRARIDIAAMANGIAQRALELAVEYSAARVQFGHPIRDFQAIQLMLGEMDAQLETARLTAWWAAAEKDAGADLRRAGSIAKWVATENCGSIVDKAVQVHGGAGYMRESEIERLYRDARILRIFEGTSQIQLIGIAATLAAAFDRHREVV